MLSSFTLLVYSIPVYACFISFVFFLTALIQNQVFLWNSLTSENYTNLFPYYNIGLGSLFSNVLVVFHFAGNSITSSSIVQSKKVFLIVFCHSELKQKIRVKEFKVINSHRWKKKWNNTSQQNFLIIGRTLCHSM